MITPSPARSSQAPNTRCRSISAGLNAHGSNWPIYFITTCTFERRRILAPSEVARILVDKWQNARHRHGWAVGRYVIMPDPVPFFCSAEWMLKRCHGSSRHGNNGGASEPAESGWPGSSIPATTRCLKYVRFHRHRQSACYPFVSISTRARPM